MVEYLILVNRFIVCIFKGVWFCCFSEVVLDLLDYWFFGLFVKEDGELIIDEWGNCVYI